MSCLPLSDLLLIAIKRDSPRSKFWGADTDLPEPGNELDHSSVEARTLVTDTRLKKFLWNPCPTQFHSKQSLQPLSFRRSPLIGQSTPFPRAIYAREVLEDLPKRLAISHLRLEGVVISESDCREL